MALGLNIIKLLLTGIIAQNLKAGILGEDTSLHTKGTPARIIDLFSIDKLATTGLDFLMEDITQKDYAAYLEDILKKLDIVEVNYKTALASVEEIKDPLTVNEALTIERKLNGFFKRFQTIVQALKILNEVTVEGKTPNKSAVLGDEAIVSQISLNDSAGAQATLNISNEEDRIFNKRSVTQDVTKQQQLLKQDIDDFKRDVKEIPDLLATMHLLILGESIVSVDQTSGLACDRVDYERRQIESTSPDLYSIDTMMKQIYLYRDSLMKLQVYSFQLRNNTCAHEDLKCRQEAIQLEDHLKEQYSRFEECVPEYLRYLSQHANLENIHIIHPELNQSLYSQQFSSIVEEGILQWDQVASSQDQGLRCLKGDVSDVWSFIKAPGSGYHLKNKDECFLSFDKQFIGYNKPLPTFWTESDKLDRRDFLICLSSETDEIATFLIYASANGQNTTYILKEKTSGKFLYVQTKETDFQQEISRRFVLVLLLNNIQVNSWILIPEGKYKYACDDAEPLSSTEDNSPGFIGAVVGTVVGAALSLLPIVSCYCIATRCIPRDDGYHAF